MRKKHEKQLIPLYFFIQMVSEKNLDFNICGRKLYISLEFNVAKQCFLASRFVPINKFQKGLTAKIVEIRSFDVIHGPNYFRL